jgi:divalent metal cation (Fe/Co/Zn/Cd) transporter
MVFNSLTFVVFFACVLALHALPLPWTTKKINLLIASYLFYAAWNPPFVILLWVSTVVDWYAAQGLVKAQRAATRHAWMPLSVIANLGLVTLGSGRVLHPATRLAVEPDLHVDEFLATAASESRDEVGNRFIPAAAAMTREKRGRHFA